MREQVVRWFLLSTLCMCFFVTAGTVGYSAVVKKYGISEEEKEQIDGYWKEWSDKQKQQALAGNASSVSTLVKTIHFVTEEETGKIEDVLIEILNARSGKLLYLTIPMDLKVTLSGNVYDKLNAEVVMVPQMFKLSMLSAYFKGQKQREAARLILEDALGLKMDYYSVLPYETFHRMFEKKADGTYVCPEEYIKEGFGWMVKEKRKEAYLAYDTDFAYRDRMIYLETYQALKKEDFLFEKVSGMQTNEAFILDEKENKAKILMFCSGQA
ncbi:MAG: hypothetical protein E7256_04310 [Lachnospiraceae bacterium]|nr:hypothetical protein [Lachnospiraceae bacterium]